MQVITKFDLFAYQAIKTQTISMGRLNTTRILGISYATQVMYWIFQVSHIEIYKIYDNINHLEVLLYTLALRLYLDI